jgi:hypothetical protein
MEKSMTLLKWIKSLFGGSTYQAELDRYIAAKHPTSVGEVEHWIRQYDNRVARGM